MLSPRLDRPKRSRRKPIWRLAIAPLERRLLPAMIGYTPAEIRHVYGFDAVTFDDHGVTVPGDGRGQTIAVFESGYAPALLENLAVFDQAFGLPELPEWTAGEAEPVGPSIRVIGVGGTLPPPGSAQTEASLDVEWIHAVAPGASILVVDGANDAQLTEADALAARMPGVSVVSNSFSTYNYLEPPQEVADNAAYTTPPGHPGVTFVDSSGDTGSPSHPPDFSPFVLSVGGTSLTLSAAGGYGAETGWAGSGGGISLYQTKPAYQDGVLPRGVRGRGVPDVAILGNPATGVVAYDPIDGGWHVGGGTSLAAPLWAAIIAIADQGRALEGLGPLDGATQTIPDLYQLPRSDFHDITVGNNGYAARPGYDLVTGLGTPYVNRVVAGLVASTATYPAPSLNATLPTPPSYYALTSGPIHATAGSPFNGIVANLRLDLPAAQAGDVIASVDWGDGSPIDTPPISVLSLGRGVFQVRTVPGGTRKTFASPGIDRIKASVTFPSGAVKAVQRTAVVSPAPLTAAGTQFAARARANFSGTVATFVDPGATQAQAMAPGATYAARISWGDGSRSAGTVAARATTPGDLVAGTHDYRRPGLYHVTVRVINVGNGPRGITSTLVRSLASVAGP